MSLSFLLDEDITPRVADGLRQRGIDARSWHETGRAGQRVPDDDVLSTAAAERRIVVTYNRADFQALDAQWRLEGRTHTGILWVSERSIPRRAIGEVIRALEAASAADESLRGLCLPLSRVPTQVDGIG